MMTVSASPHNNNTDSSSTAAAGAAEGTNRADLLRSWQIGLLGGLSLTLPLARNCLHGKRLLLQDMVGRAASGGQLPSRPERLECQHALHHLLVDIEAPFGFLEMSRQLMMNLLRVETARSNLDQEVHDVALETGHVQKHLRQGRNPTLSFLLLFRRHTGRNRGFREVICHEA